MSAQVCLSDVQVLSSEESVEYLQVLHSLVPSCDLRPVVRNYGKRVNRSRVQPEKPQVKKNHEDCITTTHALLTKLCVQRAMSAPPKDGP